MRISFLCLLLLGLFVGMVPGTAQNPKPDAEVVRTLYDRALAEQPAYHWLSQLTAIGPRMSGSRQADSATARFAAIMDSLGFRVIRQSVKVPYWERGAPEVAHYYWRNAKVELPLTALGGSVATPPEGLLAPLVEITDFAQLDSVDLQNKIAFFNIPMDPTYISTYYAYGNAVKQRYVGALEASKRGAIGVIIRSLSSSINPYPHTGSMTYGEAKQRIPAAAISTAEAEKLSQRLKEDEVSFFFKQECRWGDSTYSDNLIAEWRGDSLPEEIILVGGHFDSWDLGTGAHDDGAGCMQALAAAYLLKAQGLRLKRTLRVVFFTNEEFGLQGARQYALRSRAEGLRHVLAIESDGGGFSPRGISIDAEEAMVSRIQEFRPLLEPFGIHLFSRGGSGADISQLGRNQTLLIGLRPDSHRYFEVHHSAQDVLENVNPRELEMGSATLASLLYLLDRYDLTGGAMPQTTY